MIYVDDMAIKAKGRVWYHLMSDTDGDEIHDFAYRLGLKRHWFHTDHYDITRQQRLKAIGLGAIPCKPNKLVEIRREKRRKRMTEVKIFRLNEYEWWAGESLEQVIEAACQQTGLPIDEVADEPCELSREMLDGHTLVDAQGKVNSCSFSEGLQSLVETHRDSIPCLFATTDW